MELLLLVGRVEEHALGEDYSYFMAEFEELCLGGDLVDVLVRLRC